MIEACCRTLSRVVQAIKVQRPNPTPAVGQRCPSAVQALSKHCPSSVQAGHFRVQARLGCTSDPLGFCHFEVTKSPPKRPFYNIKRGQHIKKGAGEGRWCSTGQRSRILRMPVRVHGGILEFYRGYCQVACWVDFKLDLSRTESVRLRSLLKISRGPHLSGGGLWAG